MQKLLLLIFIASITMGLVTKSHAAKKQVLVKISYSRYYNNEKQEGRDIYLHAGNNSCKVWNEKPQVKKAIPGLGEEVSYLDFTKKQLYNTLFYTDGSKYYTSSCIDSLKRPDFIDEEREILGYACKKAEIVINSNKIELWYTEEVKASGSPYPGIALTPGLVLSIVRNGNYEIKATAIDLEKVKEIQLLPIDFGKNVPNGSLGNIKREKMVICHEIFNNEQICWGKPKLKVDKFIEDSVYYFAGGTLILKKTTLPKVPEHYSIFAELTQFSNGDAYDRTGSVFVIPTDKHQSFLDGLRDSVGVLPGFVGKDGKNYEGMVRTPEYSPAVELIRFFTSFGVKAYNERVKIPGMEWQDSSVFKQEISDLRSHLEGEVYVGAFIGNYDKGGHKVSLNLKYYPGDYEWKTEVKTKQLSIPLFNTCNIMEMGGQTYGTLFGTDTLCVEFTLPDSVENLRLKYISTGHGGWGGGDEFNPKPNTIIINDTIQFTYTPWRTDCGTFRNHNPASGNFWNGMSSSDYSRSGWCPGTLTTPEFFYLPSLPAGKHTVKVAIPMGVPQGSSFSHWSVSGVIQGEVPEK
jgi:GLPGLI family protein